MTELTRTVRRKVISQRGQPIVVAIAPEGIWLREPRRRTAYLLPYGVAFQYAVRLHVDATRREKAAARKAKRNASRQK
jgi:hypothetical protein